MYLFVETVLNYLIKKDILYVAPMYRGLFLYKKLDKKLKLTSDIIALNYIEESPFPESETNIVYIVEYPNLYLWFYREKEKKRYIPEAILLFRKLIAEKYNNILCIFQGEDINKVIVIKDNTMVSSFIKNKIGQSDIILLKEEYFIKDVVLFTEDEYKNYKEDSFRYLKYSDLLNLLNLEINLKESFNSFIKWSSFPLLISMVIISAVLAGYNFYIKNQNENLLETYKHSSKNIVKLKDSLNKNEQLNEIYKSIQKEFIYIDKSIAISNIIKIAQDLNLTLDFIRINDNNVNFVIQTEEDNKIPFYIQKLFQTQKFADVKNISSNKIKRRNIDMIRATIQAKLKERQ